MDVLGLVDVKKLGHYTFSFNSLADPYLEYKANRYNSKGFTIASHGVGGIAPMIWNDLDKIDIKAKNSGKEYIELLVCEAGQHEEVKENVVEKLYKLTKMPIKYTEDFVTFPLFSNKPSTSPSKNAKIHGWQWYIGDTKK